MSTKLNRISYTLLRIRGIKAAGEDGPPSGGGRRGELHLKNPKILVNGAF